MNKWNVKNKGKIQPIKRTENENAWKKQKKKARKYKIHGEKKEKLEKIFKMDRRKKKRSLQ